jgi:plasmid replication initiation protein
MNNELFPDLPPLIPDKHPQKELFLCDVADAALKDILPQMEHPFYSLSKKPDTSIRRYEHNGNYVEVTPSVKGMATIYDKDILIYCISQIIDKIKRGEEISKRVRINTHDLLKFTNRGVGGKDYKALSESFDRLAGTRIKTNIVTGGKSQEDNFGLVDATTLVREFGSEGRLLSCSVTISDWVFNAIRAKEVLTLHPDYFRLRKPIERRIYEVARKHCGQKKQWIISISILHKKSGSKSPLKSFRLLLKNLSRTNHLPDYIVTIDSEKDQAVFLNRRTMPTGKSITNDNGYPCIMEITMEKARKVAPGYDVYWLKEEWLLFWDDSGRIAIKNPDAAFLAFCKKRSERAPCP